MIEKAQHLFSASRAKVFGQVVFIGLCSFFLAKKLSDNWSEVRLFLTGLEWLRLVGPFMLLTLAFLFFPIGMVIFTLGGHQRINYLQSAQAFFGSQPTKYLPGSLWVFPSRIFLLQRVGFGLSLSSAALLFEMITLAFSSCIVGIFFLGIAGVGAVWSSQIFLTIVAGCLTAIGIFLVLPELIQRFFPSSFLKLKLLIHMTEAPILKRLKTVFLASATYSVMWLLAGVSFFLLLTAINSPIDTDLMLVSIGVFPFSWLIGYLSFFIPGGIGVREGVIVITLSTVLPEPYPVIAALISRAFWLIAELLFVVFVWLFSRVKLTV